MEKNIISPYLYALESKQHGYLVYNGLSNSFIKVSKEFYKMLKDAKTNFDVLCELDTDTINTLKEIKIICTKKDVQNAINKKKFLRDYSKFQHDSLNLTIVPTTACNFQCPYCYEKGIEYKTMSEDTIAKLVEFIVERSEKTQKKLNITWYGGEPLLAVGKIKKIMSELSKHNLQVVSNGIITNAYYLNKENFDFLKIIKTNFIQVTLDGSTPQSHNNKRFCKDGSGSWEIILNNIDEILKSDYNFHLAIRCNIDKNNKDEFYEINKYLQKRWNNSERVSIYPGILTDHSKNSNNDCSFFSSMESSTFLIEEGVKNKNLKYLEYNIGGCSATQFNSYLIGPEGELYKCWNDIGKEEKTVGSIFDKSKLNSEILLDYLTAYPMFEDEMCVDCCLFFVCEGGCQWERINNKISGENKNLCSYAKLNLDKYLESYYKLKTLTNEKN
ncbi:MAG: SPASM domain-containing protein [Bacteroidales bacterium]|jgi:uncharacterized protein|nr:SPASM domain-containing protein [Bacteroidales bacterium]